MNNHHHHHRDKLSSFFHHTKISIFPVKSQSKEMIHKDSNHYKNPDIRRRSSLSDLHKLQATLNSDNNNSLQGGLSVGKRSISVECIQCGGSIGDLMNWKQFGSSNKIQDYQSIRKEPMPLDTVNPKRVTWVPEVVSKTEDSIDSSNEDNDLTGSKELTSRDRVNRFSNVLHEVQQKRENRQVSSDLVSCQWTFLMNESMYVIFNIILSFVKIYLIYALFTSGRQLLPN